MEDKVSVASFRLLLNDTEISQELLSAVQGLTFDEELNLPSMFTIKFNIADFSKGDWKGIDLESFKIGDTVKIFMGIDSHVEMMTGEITSLDLTFKKSAFMEIRGYDRLHRFRFGTMRRSFKDMKDSDIAAFIASNVNLMPRVEDTKTIYPYIFQNNQSNFDFLRQRIRRIGYEMLVDDRTFIFRKSQEDKTPDLKLEYGTDFESFSIQLKTPTEGSEVQVRGWDIKKKEGIISTASKKSDKIKMAAKESGFDISEKAFGTSAISVIDDLIVDSNDAENIAKAKYDQLLKEFINGDGTCSGNPKIRAGKTIEISGFGERFSGAYYVIATVHSIKEGAYKTSFKVRRTGL